MTTKRVFYPITLELDRESIELLHDALVDHATQIELEPNYSPEEQAYVLSQIWLVGTELTAAKRQIHGLTLQAVTREHAITPDTAILEAG